MKLDIITNEYLLIWNLLFNSSVSDEFHLLKQDIWTLNRKEYSKVHQDKEQIIRELDNFIPNDDTIYNLLESNPLYKKIKIDTNKYRLKILEVWDLNKKKYNKELFNILKKNIDEEYRVLVVHPSLDIIETDLNDNAIIVGKKIILRDTDNFLTYLLYKIVKNEIFKTKTKEKEILDVLCELLITNELYTRVSGKSKYHYGKKENKELKAKIYPYFLMYLGVDEKLFDKYMIRDNIFFDKREFKYEKLLKKLNIDEFIYFLIKNKKKIFKKKIVPVEDIEIL